MASLEKLVLKLRKRKQEASKLRLKAERRLKELRSTERRSSSGLASLDKKIETEREDSSDVSDILTQKNAQLESIERLVVSAEERLNREKEALTEAEQQVEFAENPDEKQNAETRARSIKTHIDELEFEINSRKKTAKKIAEQVAKNAETKSKITSKIKKQFQSIPSLKESKTTSHKEAEKIEKELERRIKTEEIAQASLGKALTRFQALQAKKRKPTKKTTKRKAAKKTAPKKAAPKRKAAKKTAPKKAAPKRKAAKKTAPK
ncbi:MAG: ATPase V, partial [Nitrosopumilus sp.]|nr:ATPase V [Nitrosopumilus sp.]